MWSEDVPEPSSAWGCAVTGLCVLCQLLGPRDKRGKESELGGREGLVTRHYVPLTGSLSLSPSS